MNLHQILNFLRSRSPQAKTRILWTVVAVAGFGLTSLWFSSVQNQLSSFDRENLLATEQGEVLSATSSDFITVESLERRDGKVELYFKFTNNTSDILSFPDKDKISLQIGETSINPEKVLDRQQNQFVSRILSNTTKYGVLIFSEFDANRGTLIFENLSSETGSNAAYKETINLDFKKLKPLEELRS